MEILGIHFAPINIPLSRRLQTLAAGSWFIIMAFGGFMGLFLAIYLVLFTTYWWLTLIYLVWMHYDQEACEEGGRPSKWIRSWVWWKYLKAYFPAHLERVPWVDLDPKDNYLFCCFPHGMLCTGPFIAFGTEYGGFKDIFPNHRPTIMTLGQHFKMPFFRELAYGLGGCKASAKAIEYTLSRPEGGNVAVLMVGGATESFYCRPGQYKIIYDRRKGFVKLALRAGAPLVPVITFGETDLFDQVQNPEGSFVRAFQEWLKNYIGIAPAIPIGRGFFQYTFGMIPKRKPITTVIGKPMKIDKIQCPTQDQIDEVHQKFKQHLTDFFNEQKHNYVKDPENTKLEFV